jgi:serine protease AprX
VRAPATLLTTLLIALAAAPSAAAPQPAEVALERWVVGFDPATGLPRDLQAILSDLGAEDAVAITTADVLAVTLPAGAISRLRQRDDVVAVRPERRLEFDLAESVPYIGADRAVLGAPETVTVEGPNGPEQVERPAVDGTGQVVAVVDTGVLSEHPGLAGQVIAQRNFELAYAGELLLTPEQLDTFAAATGPLAGPGDDVGHGTHVAGIVAGTGEGSAGRRNENRGVAPGARLVDLRISPQAHTTDNNIGWERNALAAYDWLLRHHDDPEFGSAGIRVVNNSWGTGESTLDGEQLDYSPFATILSAATQKGISVVFSAGNSGTGDDVTEDLLPTGHPDVITVAAGCKPGASSNGCQANAPDRRIATFSSRGPAVDVTAPGVDIVSTVNPSSGAVLGQLSGNFAGGEPKDEVINRAQYANFSGTSMSGPHVAGLVALLLDADPTLTPSDVRFILGATARDLLQAGREIHSGWGMIDARAALVAAVRHAAGTPLAEQFPNFDGAATLQPQP